MFERHWGFIWYNFDLSENQGATAQWRHNFPLSLAKTNMAVHRKFEILKYSKQDYWLQITEAI